MYFDLNYSVLKGLFIIRVQKRLGFDRITEDKIEKT